MPCSVLLLGPEPPSRLGAPGIDVIVWSPIIQLKPIPQSSNRFVEEARSCDWIVFTSPRAPRILFSDASGRGVVEEVAKILSSRKIAAVGPSTAKSLEEAFNVRALLVPRTYTGGELGAELVRLKPECVALVRSLQGVKELPQVLREHGVEYKEIPVYTEEPNLKAIPLVIEAAKRVNYVLLTSPMIARLYCSYVAPLIAPRAPKLLAIGPSTLREARRYCEEGVVGDLPKRYTYQDLLVKAASMCRE